MRKRLKPKTGGLLLSRVVRVQTAPLCFLSVFACLLSAHAVPRTAGESLQESPTQAGRAVPLPGSDGAFHNPHGSPAWIVYIPLGAAYALENHSDKRIVRYQVGCVVDECGRLEILSRKKEGRVDLPPADLLKNTFPFTYVSVRQVKKECVSKGAKVSVVEVTFTDGTVWQAKN